MKRNCVSFSFPHTDTYTATLRTPSESYSAPNYYYTVNSKILADPY